jgi:hypothetical protein
VTSGKRAKAQRRGGVTNSVKASRANASRKPSSAGAGAPTGGGAKKAASTTAAKKAGPSRARPGTQAASVQRRRPPRRGASWTAAAVVAAAVVVTAVLLATSNNKGAAPPHTVKPDVRPASSVGHLQPATSIGPPGPEGVPIPTATPLAPANSRGTTVDGIKCETSEQTLFHIHAHLTIYVNGAARQVPYGIGIPGAQTQSTPQGRFVTSGRCFTWLHTHADDGIIHIESPVERTFTLGDFFDVWGQPLSADQVGPAKGKVTAFFDGQVYVGNVRNIPLDRHAQIQLDVGSPLIAPVSITFPSGL